MNILKIANKGDRRAITAILPENGYKVWQGKEKLGKGSVFTYFVGYEERGNGVDEKRITKL